MITEQNRTEQNWCSDLLSAELNWNADIPQSELEHYEKALCLEYGNNFYYSMLMLREQIADGELELDSKGKVLYEGRYLYPAQMVHSELYRLREKLNSCGDNEKKELTEQELIERFSQSSFAFRLDGLDLEIL